MKKLIAILILITFFAFKVADNRSVYNIPVGAAAVCAADQDMDGDMDIFTEHLIGYDTQWGGTYILKNDGFGHFSFMDSLYSSTGMNDIYADTVFNNTYPEIISGGPEHVNFLSYNGDKYSQIRYYIGSNVNAFDIGDVDNNGHIDVVFTSSFESYWGIIYNEGNNTFSAPEYYNLDYRPTDIVCDDLNNDGRDDLVIAGIGCEIYFSTLNGFITQPLLENAFNVKIADFDNDNDNDIVTFSTAGPMTFVQLYKNTGNNIFDTIGYFDFIEGTSRFFVSDFNNDSLPDLLFAAYPYNGGYTLYYNLGNFQFGEPQLIELTYYGEGLRSTSCADMDGNSYMDIVVARRIFYTTTVPSLVEILFNDGQGNFVCDPLTTIESEMTTIAETKFINYPNPFSTNTTFEFTIAQTSNIEISVYNLQGKLVKVLLNKKMEGGKHKVKWDGLNNASQACKPGPYIAYLKVNGSLIQSIKLIIN